MAAPLRRASSVALVASALLACATPVGVRRGDPEVVHRELTASVLSVGRPSTPTLQVLERENLRARFDEDPDATLAELHRRLDVEHDRGRLFALAELSFLRGERTGDRGRYLACAIYAWALLFPGADRPVALDASDPRLRLTYDLYNRGLTAGLATDDRVHVDLSPRSIALPFGSLALALAAPAEPHQWAGYRIDDFVAAADLRVRGLRNRYRRPGIGAPLVAALHGLVEGAPASTGHFRIPPRTKVPVTALVRIADARAALVTGRVDAALELYSQDTALDVEIAGRRVPLEFETTSAFAYTLEGAKLWDFELAGFFSNALRPVEVLFGSDPMIARTRTGDGLFLLHPYHPGRIPIVLVHGTASSPARWAELINELENDRRIWDRYQIWLFIYNTGNPVGYSGGLLRHALRNTVAELDPNGQDPALHEMVVIGHSQGGLLAKLTAVSSGDRFWRLASDRDFDSIRLSPEDRETLANSVFFEPLPFVKRLVFIATPHHGSYLASFSVVRLMGGIITLPTTLLRASIDALIADPLGHAMRSQRRLPTAIDDLTPGNPFLEVLASLPIAPGVAANSIIAVRGDGPLEHASDGVVRYESAHIEGVESEKLVHSGQSTQEYPDTIEEVRRILLEHAGEQ